MIPALLIARRDLGAYLHGLTGYVIVAAVLFVNGILFQAFALGDSAKYSHEVLEHFFYFSSGTTMIASVLLTMRAIAEERQTETEVLLQTSPVSDTQVVVGKYLAAMGMLGLLTAMTAYMPALIFWHGKVSLAHVGVGYLGLMALGSATCAIGIFGSSLFRNQMAAAILSGVLVVTLLILWMVADKVEAPFEDLLAYMALYNKHFVPFQEGRLSTAGLVYFASATFAFLMLSIRVLEGRRWR